MAGPDSSLYDSIQSSATCCRAELGLLTASEVETKRARSGQGAVWSCGLERHLDAT